MSSQEYWDQVDENILLQYLTHEMEEEKKATVGEFEQYGFMHLII